MACIVHVKNVYKMCIQEHLRGGHVAGGGGGAHAKRSSPWSAEVRWLADGVHAGGALKTLGCCVCYCDGSCNCARVPMAP